MTDDIPMLEARALGPDDLDEIMLLQAYTIAALPDKSVLRNNPRELLAECLQAPNVALGVWDGPVLAAIGVLYFPGDGPDNIAGLLETPGLTGLPHANFKLCIVRTEYRGRGLQRELGRLLEVHARLAGVRLLCANVSPNNPYSRNNFLALGYTQDRQVIKYGHPRDLFFKRLD